MPQKILVPTDGSNQAKKAIDFACEMALKYNAMVYFAHVVSKVPIPDYVLEYVKMERVEESPERVYLNALGKKIIEAAESQARARGVKNFKSVVLEGDPSEEIIKFIETSDADMIVMGNRGLGGVKQLLMGSVSHKVCNAAHCTCVTVK